MNTGLAVLLAAWAVFCVIFGQEQPKCEHPPKPEFLNKVDENARKEFFDIVKNHDIPPEQKKEKVIAWGQQHGFAEEVKKHEEMIQEMRKQGKLCKPPLPDFLKNANETLRKEFFDIIKQHNVPLPQKREQVIEWAKKYGLEKEAREHEEKMKKMFGQVRLSASFISFSPWVV
ncbi:hypothetical protein COOONC_15521 [Cooperia oncophora]